MAPRNYRRFYFDKPVKGRLQIIGHKGKEISCLKYADIYILDISQGGLCFCSDLNFPCSDDYTVKITFGVETVIGYIVWNEARRGKYTHGFKITSFTVGFLAINYELKVFSS